MCECQDVMAARRKRIVLEYAEGVGSVTKACREFEVPRSSFYRWKAAFGLEGTKGLRKKRPVAWKHPRQLSSEAIEKILHLRRQYHLGPQRITWYLERLFGVRVSGTSQGLR